jgi:hypothetical protein
MALPEYVAPVLSIAGPVALVYVILRFGPDAVLRLLAGIVAVVSGNDERGKRCLEVLRVLRGRDRDNQPPYPCPDTRVHEPDGEGQAP